MYNIKLIGLAGVMLAAIAVGCSKVEQENTQALSLSDRNIEESQAVVLLRQYCHY